MTMAQPVVVRLDSVDYMLGPSYDLPAQLVDRTRSSTVLGGPFPTPVTIIAGGDVTDLRQSWLDEQFETMATCDDVWCQSFTKNVILQTQTQKFFTQLNDETFEGGSSEPLQNSETRIPTGPYFLLNSKLYQAFRLFPDPLGAFVCGVIPNTAANSIGTEAAR
jgi:hypothetical protein